MEMIMEKQKQSQLIHQSQQLLQYMISSQVPSPTLQAPHPSSQATSPAVSARGQFLTPSASPGGGYYGSTSSPLPPLQLPRSITPTPTDAARPPLVVTRAALSDRDKRRRSTSSVQNIW
jgi:hypothetical protein